MYVYAYSKLIKYINDICKPESLDHQLTLKTQNNSNILWKHDYSLSHQNMEQTKYRSVIVFKLD